MEENVGSKNANYFTTFFYNCDVEKNVVKKKIICTCVSEKQPPNVCHVKLVAKKL